MQDNLATQSGLKAPLISSSLAPFSNDAAVNGIALDKKMSRLFPVHLNLMLFKVSATQMVQLLVYWQIKRAGQNLEEMLGPNSSMRKSWDLVIVYRLIMYANVCLSDLRRCKLDHKLLARKDSVIQSGIAVIILLGQRQSRHFFPQGWLSWAISEVLTHSRHLINVNLNKC